jgi:predicted amidohydrolase YtcJ
VAPPPGAAADGGAAAAPPRRGRDIDTLIRNARLGCDEALVDVAISGDTIRQIGVGLAADAVDQLVDADGGTLLPGLHDHHIHLMSLAASLDSLHCGPPEITEADTLASVLRAENGRGGGWLRGIAYHPCVAGEIDREWLDRRIPDRPVRIQHRGGRLWLLNSRALAELGVLSGGAPAGLESVDGRYTGRLYEGDAWLRERLESRFPDLSRVGGLLARFGVTGVTDATPSNGCAEWSHFRHSQDCAGLLQRVRVMGCLDIEACEETELLQRGEHKIHLLESHLPDFDDLCRAIGDVHARDRAVAVHCVSLAELVFALAAFERAGSVSGDRVEHASVATPEQLRTLREMGLRVVTQPHFIAERGDQYLAEVDGDEQPWLYRCATFLASGIPLAAGSDAPFGGADPWRAMRAATERTTRAGALMSERERLTPEQALSLYLCRPEAPGTEPRRLAPGTPADLCLLASPWRTVRRDLDSRHVRMTWRAGELVYCAD